MPNRLADETSPYLLQHAENPVDWYPWGDEALERARTEKKPIFLSVGYSACHWCHVMEHESFENAAIAAYLNEHFVNIKVDREERPDIDNIYMEAVQLMTGQGGWPMSVFLTPGLEPFYAGTYFPPEDRWGRPGFMSVLQQLVAVWEDDEDRIAQVTGQVLARMKQSAEASSSGALSRELVSAAVGYFDRVFDDVDGGFGDAPKFPPSAAVQLLMHASQDDDASDGARSRALDMAEQTLVHMAMGGIYDHVGGGFHRYAVDTRWLVPHFEKMLYDNALLICAYTEAFRVTGRPLYERVVRETIAWLDREMTLQTESGHALYSSQDADSEGEEGKFFVWSPEEIAAVLGSEASEAGEFWGVSADGNFEGRTILNRLHLIEDDWTLGFEELPDWVDQRRAMLHAARTERVPPGTDHKVLAGWNGLAISALARAGAVFAEPEWRDRAASIATFVLERMVDADGNLLRTFKDDRARFPAYMDDYAFMTAGLVDLFETRGELAWLERAIALGERADELFWDNESGGYYFTAEHHRDLIVRQKERFDGATPSSNSIAAMNLLRLSVLTGRTELRDRADRLLQGFVDVMQRAPRGAAQFLVALDFHLRGPREFVFFTPEDGVSLAADAWREALGHAVVVDVPPSAAETWATLVPLVRDRAAVDGKPTVYICRDGACDLPQHGVGAL